MSGINGVINVYKEKGYTSHDIVAIIRKQLSISKVGHTGTLDPAAEGVLPVCVGRATKISSFIMAEDKGYHAVVKLGICTDTQDDTGNITQTAEVVCGRDEVQSAVASFKGCYSQTPPMYSAIKIGGKKLYELARKGETVHREKRECCIHDISIRGFIDDRTFKIDVLCSKGTYIRALCADIGEKLGCGACMGELLRYKSGDFTLDHSVTLTRLKESVSEGSIDTHIIPIASVLSGYKRIKIAPMFNKPLYNGNVLLPEYLKVDDPPDRGFSDGHNAAVPGEKVVVYDDNNDIVGIYEAFINNAQILYKPTVMIRLSD